MLFGPTVKGEKLGSAHARYIRWILQKIQPRDFT